jgi:glycosyltransferase involved in cell wall biosynthesis
MQAADVLSLPSHNEGVPNVVLEAMACGLPVVATRVGGIPEVLPGHAGILVPAHDHQALGRALADALQRDWSRDRILEHAARFRWDDNVRQLDRILRDAATPLSRQ